MHSGHAARSDSALNLPISIGSIATQQVPIAMLGHPFGARQVAFPSSARARRFCRGIDVQHRPRYLAPISAFGLGIKEPHIGDEMFLVVGGQGLGARSKIGHRWIKRRLGHVAFTCRANHRAAISEGNDRVIAIHICRAATTS